MKSLYLLALVCACSLPLVASAQWQWIDKDGRKVFSDRGPPSDVPEKNILRRPGGSQRSAPAPAPAAAEPADDKEAAAPTRTAGAPKQGTVDKALEEKKRKAEEAEKAERAAEEQKVAKAKAENCTRARQSKTTFDSGIRVARLNEKGEREVMDDKARAAETQRLQTVIESDCK